MTAKTVGPEDVRDAAERIDGCPPTMTFRIRAVPNPTWPQSGGEAKAGLRLSRRMSGS